MRTVNWQVWTIAGFWLAALAVLVFALLPHPGPMPGSPTDKQQHMFAFGVLTALACWAFPSAANRTRLALLAGFGAAIEFLQMIPALHRNADIMDWLADCGAILAALALVATFRFVRGRER